MSCGAVSGSVHNQKKVRVNVNQDVQLDVVDGIIQNLNNYYANCFIPLEQLMVNKTFLLWYAQVDMAEVVTG
jgi:hypothetical protein